MYNIINEIVMYLLSFLSFIYVYQKIENKKIDYKNIKVYIAIIITTVTSIFIHTYFNNMLRPIIMLIINSLLFKQIFKIQLSESIINCFITYIIVVIAELIELIFVFIILKLPNTLLENYLLNKIPGSIINLLLVILITNIAIKFILKIKNILYKEKNINFIWIIIISLSAFISLYINNLKLNINFIITSICCSLIIFVILLLFKEIMDKNELKSEYDKLFNYTESTESLLTKYQKYNHENKNQLILIRETLKSKNKTEKLINEILEDDIEHTNKWLNELKNIPSGGLKGFLSYKINNMTDNGINVYLSISPRLKELNLSKAFNMKTYKELCQMIGVYMDNAYEASIETEEKNVALEMFYQDGTINFVISNTFNENINLDKIDEAGYSTKGKERGIGLSLVKDIVEKNNKINVNREVIQNYY